MMKFKQGDFVIHTNEQGVRSVRKVGYVGFEDVFRLDIGNTDWNQDGKPAYRVSGYEGSIVPATQELLAEVKAENEQRRTAAQAEQERIANDPKTPYNSRFQCGSDDWTKLTIEQLKTIAGWLDAA